MACFMSHFRFGTSGGPSMATLSNRGGLVVSRDRLLTTQEEQIGNKAILALFHNSNEDFESVLDSLSPADCSDDLFWSAYNKRTTVTHDTHHGYVTKFNRIVNDWYTRKLLLEPYENTPDLLQKAQHNLSAWFCTFIAFFARKKLASSTLAGYLFAFIYICEFFGYHTKLNRPLLKASLKSAQRRHGKKPKPTAAFSKKILRFLFQYLFEADPDMFRFVAFFFFGAFRASEMLKLHETHFEFSDEHSDKEWVRLHIKNGKTKKRHADDEHIITFVKQEGLNVPDNHFPIRPYELALFWYKKACKHPQGFVAPFEGTYSQRSTALYRWFSDMKYAFARHMKQKFSKIVDISKWRLHMFRTSFVGIMRSIGLSWEQIQFRTGHKIGSEVTKDVYYFNALISEELDSDFNKKLEQNLENKWLFLMEGDCRLAREDNSFTRQERDDMEHWDKYGAPIDTPKISKFLQKTSTPFPKSTIIREPLRQKFQVAKQIRLKKRASGRKRAQTKLKNLGRIKVSPFHKKFQVFTPLQNLSPIPASPISSCLPQQTTTPSRPRTPLFKVKASFRTPVTSPKRKQILISKSKTPVRPTIFRGSTQSSQILHKTPRTNRTWSSGRPTPSSFRRCNFSPKSTSTFCPPSVKSGFTFTSHSPLRTPLTKKVLKRRPLQIPSFSKKKSKKRPVTQKFKKPKRTYSKKKKK